MRLTFLLVTIAIFGFFLPLLAVDDVSGFYRNYGFSLNNFLERPYVILTSVFMHASLTHLLSNVLVWLFFGLAVEDEMGKKRMLVVFLLGAFAGNLIGLLIYAPDTIAIGASAGVFALVGAGMLVRPLDLSFYPLVIPVPLVFLGILYAVYNAYAFLTGIDPNVSYIGHFGGLFVGLFFGFRKTGIKKGLKIILVAIGIMVVIMAAALLLLRQNTL